MSIPKGWKLVPVEPTLEMLHDASEVDLEEETPEAYQEYLRAIYRRLVDAAPTTPVQQDDEALEPDMQSAWISVQDRMPPDDTPVLVYVPGNEMLAVAIDQWQMQREAPLGWSSATIETGMGWGDHDYEDVSHWMPLTAPGHPLAARLGVPYKQPAVAQWTEQGASIPTVEGSNPSRRATNQGS